MKLPQNGFLERNAWAALTFGLLLGAALSTVAFSILTNRANSGEVDGARRVLKLSHSLDRTHPVHLAMEFMANDLAERSSGQLRIDIYPNAQLGSETDSIEQIQSGVIALAKTSTAAMEGFFPEMALFGLPYLFRDADHFWDVLEGEIGDEILAMGIPMGLRGLCYYDGGSRSFYTTSGPILHPNDLRGKKIRVMQSKMAMDMISQMGGAPTPIPWGELYTALQQGMVDGAENNPPSLYTSRHFEVAKHYSLDEHTRIPDMIFFSERIWVTLSPQEQQWIQESADLSVGFQRKIWDEQSAANIEALKENGVQIYYPDKGPFIESVAPLVRSFDGTKIGEYAQRILSK